MRNVRQIIDACGGADALAERLSISGWAIHKWPKNGIPEKHWAALIDIAESSPQELFGANERARVAAQDTAA